MANPRNTVSFHTLGCKLNQAETDSIKDQFVARGFTVLPFGEKSEISIINTCTITNTADSKSRQIIRRSKRISPAGKTVVVGCYAQIQPEQIAQIEGVDMILGTQDKFLIFNYIDLLDKEIHEKPDIFVSDISNQFYEDSFISKTSRTRAVLKVQEGCDYSCSYCIVPFARGRARSRLMANTLDEAKRLVDARHSEIVLSGINLGIYCDDNNNRLVDLLCELEKIHGLRRIRISSIEPNLLTEEIIDLVANSEKICRHFHLPLQHASDSVLRTMRRRYNSQMYRDRVKEITEKIHIFGLGADVMVGFPGETSEDFETLCRFVEDLPFSYLHIFRFSRRKGTVADLLPDQIDFHIKKKRAEVLAQLAQKKQNIFAGRFVGKTLEVLFETMESRQNLVFDVGHSEFYHKVAVPFEKDITHKFRSVRVNNIENGLLVGEVANQQELVTR